jgi:DNA-binding beta-propeller fold protein YncE
LSTPERVIWRRRLVALAILLGLSAGVAVAASDDGRPGGARTAAGAPRALAAGRSRLEPGGSGSGSGGPAGNLRPGSDPSVLPGPVLIADRDNNRLVEVSPQGKVIWRFPARGELAASQSFRVPDDAFFSADGRRVIATQEDDDVISVIDPASSRIVYRYGHPGEPGSEPGYLHNPDDALLMPSGEILAADIMNCRLLVIRPPRHRALRQLGVTGSCEHRPGVSFGSPNGAFPMAGGNTVVTEINGNWVDEMSVNGQIGFVTHPPGAYYPSDTNEVRPGVYLTTDFSSPGLIEEFGQSGNLLWRYQPAGTAAMDHPSLALPLPGGDVICNDDFNHRVIVVDPRTNRIIWQYGHTGIAGRSPGFLNDPDGVDLMPPLSLDITSAATMGEYPVPAGAQHVAGQVP